MHRTSRPAARLTSAVAATALLLSACGGEDSDSDRTPALPTDGGSGGATEQGGQSPSPSPEAETSTTPPAEPTETPTEDEQTEEPTAEEPAEASVSVATTGLQVPWGLVQLPDGSLLVGERDTARLYRVTPESEPQLLGEVPSVVPGNEGGLLGLALHPDDPTQLYAYLTADADNRVLRLSLDLDADPALGPDAEVIFDAIPKAGVHNGGRIAFGPDGLLYVATGDAGSPSLSQDPEFPAGKILRLTTEGDPAPGNPIDGSAVYSLGHRNVQGLDWDADGRLWASEFGQNTWDEVNLIEPGGNYGWPEVEGIGEDDRFIDPVVAWTPEESSPSGVAVGPDGALYVAGLRGQSLWRVPLDGDTVGEPQRLLQGEYGRLRSVVTGADGDLWVLTNNTFRGDPDPDDDRLLRIVAPDLLD